MSAPLNALSRLAYNLYVDLTICEVPMVDTDFAWRLMQGLVRIDSSDPGAYEGEIERYIKALVEERLAQLSHPVLDAVQIAELKYSRALQPYGHRKAGQATSRDSSISVIWIPLPWAIRTQTRRHSERLCVTTSSTAAVPAT